MKKQKRKIKLGYLHYFMANDAKYLERRPEIKEALLEHERELRPDDCLSCMFYKSIFTANCELAGGMCAAAPLIQTETNRIPDDCPLKRRTADERQ